MRQTALYEGMALRFHPAYGFLMGKTKAYGQGPLARRGAVQALALIAMLFHIVSPLALQLARPAADGLFQTIICSGGVWKTVSIDEEGNPVEAPAAPGSASHDCSICIHHCGAAALSAFLALPSPQWALPAPLRVAFAGLSGVVLSDSHPRAPPA
ncbi:MAG: hypothetical protein U0942_12110 [Parvibaculum sp.]|uniref:DUF2946 family protein n=1 Tax=Parvibaculum sp. TaxID=2024848 RepID=UPI002AB95097|nr:DUF2946 family protein [Parvibaculum sp.]MDZ4382073.1 hypothetical protein [Parvibaculum sp.]